MKLTKNRLLKLVGEDFQRMGYVHFDDGLFGSDGLFIKKVTNSLFLTFGLIISRHYDSLFTGSFYLSKSIRWGSIWGDIPKDSYKRVGMILTESERDVLFDEQFRSRGVNDGWWDAANSNSVERFIEAVKISEQRFVNQSDLIPSIENSIEGNLLAEYASTAIDIFNSKRKANHVLKFIPSKPIKNIPLEWFEAAEVSLTNHNGIISSNNVKFLATDAWLRTKL